MEVFCGKWQVDTSSAGSMLAAIREAGHAELVKEMEEMEAFEIDYKDGSLTIVSHFSGGKAPRTDSFKLGEPHEILGPGGIRLLSLNRLEGDRFISEVSVGEKQVMSMSRYLQDGAMFTDFSAAGKSMTFKSERV